uniref:Retrovirus-related Pol polyprotein LINE-1 n=1 Tax=Tanacetum cinerariifolium TaxID=118510 RepID=A0A6L2JQI7_TANCI|nr:retrovirus-related Pol polyprotein LINE-1 [Tanacetum cinerariifolium]
MQDEVMTRLYAELSELRRAKSELDRKSGDVLASLAKVRKEKDKVLETSAEKKGKGKGKGEDERSGFGALPNHCLSLCYGFFAAAILINVARDTVPKKWARFIPIPMAIAIPFYIGSYFAVDMCIGSLILFIWEKRNKAEAAAFGPAVASGLICGEGLWSVPKSILAIAKIYPPICMKFLSRRMNVNVDAFITTLVSNCLHLDTGLVSDDSDIIVAAKARVWWRPRDGDNAIANEITVNMIAPSIHIVLHQNPTSPPLSPLSPRSKSYKLLPHRTGHAPPRASLIPAIVVGYFNFFGEKQRFGTSQPASGDSALFYEFNPGTLAASAAATGNHCRCRWGPLPMIGKFISLATAEIEVVDSDGHLRSCLSGLGGVGGYRGTRSCYRVTGSRWIRVGSWNVGSLTSKLFELSDALGRHKVDIACFQETKWKGSRAREGNGYKLWYSGSSSARNGVGVVVARRLKDDVVRVTRRSDTILAILVVIYGEEVNVISAYAPQVGLRSDLNGHIEAATDGYEGVHGGFGFEERNEEGRSILGFATAHDMVVANSFFKKSEAHLITFQGGGRRRRRREATGRPRILWKNLKGEAVETFRATVSEKLSALEEDMYARNTNQMWNTLASVIRDVAKDSLGVASESARTHSTHMEYWWFCEERYKVVKREAKIVVAQAKDKAYENLYRKLDSKEGGNDIYKIAKARERRGMDIGNVRYIKDEGGQTISRLKRSEDVGSSGHQMHYDYYRSRINQGEVGTALQRMERNKTVGPDQIPIEAWRYEVPHQEVDLRIGDWILQPNESFRAASGVLCDRRIPLKLKGKFYRVAIRPAMLCGLECWPIIKAQANRVEVAKLRMLRWTCGKTMVDMIPNGVFRAELDVDSIIDRMREGRLRWFGHVKRRTETAPVRRVEAMLVEGSRMKGRPKLRWEDRLKQDIKELLLSEDMTTDMNAWRDRIRISG